MNVDAQAKRWFPFIVLSMVGLVIYFQASAFRSLLDPPEGEPTTAPSTSAPPALETASAAPTAPAPEPVAATPEHSTEERATKREGPCGFGKVTLIVAADDPRYSFASITGADGKAKMRWVGDEVDGHVVAEMSWDRVYLEKEGSRCQLAVAGTRRAQAPPEPAEGLASKIRKVSETEFTIDRAAVPDILAQQAALMGSAHMRPVKEGDVIVGLRLSRVEPGSLLEMLGLRTGDRLEAINGVSLTDPEKAFEAYRRLESAGSLRMDVHRQGRPVTIAIEVR